MVVKFWAILYHEDSHKVINLIFLATKAHMPYNFLRKQIYNHPTMSEDHNTLLAQPINSKE